MTLICLGNHSCLYLNTLGLQTIRLKSYLQIEEGIILWSTFWETVSQLMTGATLDEVISNDKDVRKRSDSEIARELQAEFDGGPRPRSGSEVAREYQKEWNAVDSSADEMSPAQMKDDAGMMVDTPDRSMLHRNDSLADGKEFCLLELSHHTYQKAVNALFFTTSMEWSPQENLLDSANFCYICVQQCIKWESRFLWMSLTQGRLVYLVLHARTS